MLSAFVRLALLAELVFGSAAALATAYPIGVTPTSIITNGDMSQATVVSPAIPVFGIQNVAVQCSWTSTPTGTFYVQLGLDGSTWNTPTLTPTPGASGASGSFTLDMNQITSPYFRIEYVRTSGSGTLNCKAYGKNI